MSLSLRVFALTVWSVILTACTPHYEPMGPPVTEPRIDGDSFIARDGTMLPLTVWGPRENPQKVVVAAHSFGEFRDAFSLIGKHFAERNIAVWAYDQRGFGDAPHRGLWAGTDTMISDFEDFVGAVRAKTAPDTPLVLIGESMGAAVVIGAVSRGSFEEPDAVILSGPGVREDRPHRYWFNVGLWVLTRVAAAYEVTVPRPYDNRLADYHATRWANDRRIIDHVRLDTYYGLIRLSDHASEAAAMISAPALVLFGTEDSQIHPKSICALGRRLGANGALKVFDGGPHLMFQVKHQNKILNLIETWIKTPGENIPNDLNQFCSSG